MRQPFLKKSQQGLAMVEFSIGIMVFIVLLLVAAEVGRLLFQYNILSQSVRAGARFASANALTPALVLDLPSATAETVNLVTKGQLSGGTSQLPGFGAGDVTVTATYPSGAAKPYVTVAATYGYTPLFSTIPNFWAAGSFNFGMNLNSTITMRVIR